MASRNCTKKRPLRDKKESIKDALDIPQALNPSLPHIEAEGNREIAVDCCKGILEYTEDRIKLNAGSLIITFSGSNIEIKVYSDIQTVIAGDIVSIEFEN